MKPVRGHGHTHKHHGSDPVTLSGEVPIGGIILWSGHQKAIPDNWVLCDGDNNTPDLRGKFVIGYSTNYPVSNEGGTETHDHITPFVAGTSSVKYNSPPDYGTDGGSHNTTYRLLNDSSADTDLEYAMTSESSNMPPYFALCYIMRVS